jgi:hypothetical protein
VSSAIAPDYRDKFALIVSGAIQTPTEGTMETKMAACRRLAVAMLLLSGPAVKALADDPQSKDSPSKQPSFSESAGKVHLAVNDPRPLAQAFDVLQQQYGWRINYEDPQYTAKPDLADAKGAADQSSASGSHKIPAGGNFAVDFPSGSAPNTPPDEQKTLQLMVDAYNHSENPGRFELRQDSPEQFDVVGTSARDSQGKISTQPAPLDLAITIPSAERTIADTIDILCQKVSEKSHHQITLGVHPLGLDRAKITIGGKELKARAYLVSAIEPSGRKISWRLIYDPESKSYVLNLHIVRNPSPKSGTSSPKS